MVNLPSQHEIEQAVLDSTNEFIGIFKSSVYSFLYESDIQAILFTTIRSKVCRELSMPGCASERSYVLHLVYTEYNGRIDIACLDPSKASTVLPKSHKGFDTYIYGLPVFIGIEIKYRKMGDVRLDFTACLDDLRKLKRLQHVQHFFILAFLQDHMDLNQFLSTVPEGWGRSSVSSASKLDSVYVITREDTLEFSNPSEAIRDM